MPKPQFQFDFARLALLSRIAARVAKSPEKAEDLATRMLAELERRDAQGG